MHTKNTKVLPITINKTFAKQEQYIVSELTRHASPVFNFSKSTYEKYTKRSREKIKKLFVPNALRSKIELELSQRVLCEGFKRLHKFHVLNHTTKRNLALWLVSKFKVSAYGRGVAKDMTYSTTLANLTKRKKEPPQSKRIFTRFM